MRKVVSQSGLQRLQRTLDGAWDILAQRIATGRVKINKEASLQLHYSAILLSYGELLCTHPGETFSIELETALERQSIDVVCRRADLSAAVELKCFRKRSNRPVDTDMYDVLRDIERLMSYPGFDVRRFICLTDSSSYALAPHSGHAGSVSIRDGTVYPAGTIIEPSWAGKWKDRSRDAPIEFTEDVNIEWVQDGEWYVLSLTFGAVD